MTIALSTRQKEVIYDIVILTRHILLLHADKESTDPEAPKDINAELKTQRAIAQNEGLLDYLIDTFPLPKDGEESPFDPWLAELFPGQTQDELLKKLYTAPPIPVKLSEQDKLDLLVICRLQKDIDLGLATEKQFEKAIQIYHDHVLYGSESSSFEFPLKGQEWKSLPNGIYKLSETTRNLVNNGDVTRYFEHRENTQPDDNEIISTTLSLTRYQEYKQKIDNKIWWLETFSFNTKKIQALKEVRKNLQNPQNLTVDKSALEEHRFGSIGVTQSQSMFNHIMADLTSMTTDNQLAKYYKYQTCLEGSIEKIGQQLWWLNFYSGLCYLFQWMGSVSTTLEIVHKKITAFNDLLVKMNTMSSENPDDFKTSTLVQWKMDHQTIINNHTFVNSAHKTKSQTIIDELDNDLETIDNTLTSKLIN